jgi:hypothetical protein
MAFLFRKADPIAALVATTPIPEEELVDSDRCL